MPSAGFDVCSVPACDRPARARRGGMCNSHRHWSFMHGGAMPTHPIRPPGAANRIARLSRAVDSGCIEWIGFRDAKGYGRSGSDRDTGERQAYRMAWVVAHGPIPEGMTIDHLCRNTSCVNVRHMEVVTASENVRRRYEASR